MRIQIFYHQNYFNCTVIDKISPNSLPIAVGEWNLNLHFNDNYIHLHFLHRVMINWKIKQFLTELSIISILIIIHYHSSSYYYSNYQLFHVDVENQSKDI